jgi:P pilus assembly chaperone PapD
MKSFKFLGLIITVLFLISPILSNARIGVGVGAGKIQLDEELKAGGVYQLPSLPIFNTGDKTSDYEVTIEYHENIPQLRPEREWFSFSPQSFTLEPGKIQNVDIVLTLPLEIQPGEYFAYLEGHPTKKDVNGSTVISIAAATKLYFTVAPANIFEGIYYRVSGLFVYFMPWSMIVLVSIILILLIVFLRKKFSFNFGVSRK